MKKSVVLLIVLYLPVMALSQEKFDQGYTDLSKWDLVWSDEFNLHWPS